MVEESTSQSEKECPTPVPGTECPTLSCETQSSFPWSKRYNSFLFANRERTIFENVVNPLENLTSEAFVTAMINDFYLPGTLVLAYTIRKYSKVPRDVVAVVTDKVSDSSLAALRSACIKIKLTPDLGNPLKNYQPRFESVFSKLNIWSLTEYSRVLYMDADQFVFKELDSAFERFKPFAATQRWDRKHSFTSMFMLFEPSTEMLSDMSRKIVKYKGYEGADMSFLNNYFNGEKLKWNPIPHHYIAYRRNVRMNPGLWNWTLFHGIDCSGLKEDKPWGERWLKQKPVYLPIYQIWWEDYYEMISKEIPKDRNQFRLLKPSEYSSKLKCESFRGKEPTPRDECFPIQKCGSKV